jgi:nitrate/nitrite transport system ATP-binding protein
VSFISVADLSKSFGQGADAKPVLRNVSLSVERGEFVCIVGAMGSGKSTLLGLLAGLHRPDTGRVTIDGVPVQDIPKNAAFVFQNYSLLPWFTALENVRLAVDAACPDLSKDEQRARATRALEQVGLGNALGRRPRQLSGGMRQRVAIARAFATDPEVLFLDEPFGALDALTRETLQADLVALTGAAGRPVTTVMVTNNVEEALLLADRIIPVMAGPPATLGTPIAVTLPRPRTVVQLAHDEQASHMRSHVVATLTASLGRRRARPALSAVVATDTVLEVQE